MCLILETKDVTCKRLLTMSAGEAFPVPRIIPVGHTSLGNHLDTYRVLGHKMFLINYLIFQRQKIENICRAEIDKKQFVRFKVLIQSATMLALTLLHLMHLVANFSS